MIYSRHVGDAKIYNVIEYSGPTHAADFVFPELDVRQIVPHLNHICKICNRDIKALRAS